MASSSSSSLPLPLLLKTHEVDKNNDIWNQLTSKLAMETPGNWQLCKSITFYQDIFWTVCRVLLVKGCKEVSRTDHYSDLVVLTKYSEMFWIQVQATAGIRTKPLQCNGLILHLTKEPKSCFIFNAPCLCFPDPKLFLRLKLRLQNNAQVLLLSGLWMQRRCCENTDHKFKEKRQLYSNDAWSSHPRKNTFKTWPQDVSLLLMRNLVNTLTLP